MALVKAKFEVGGDKPKTIPVHFNPNEYSIHTVSGSKPKTVDYNSSDDQQQQYQTIGKNDYEELSFTLHFDTYTRYWDSSNLTSSIAPMAFERGDVRAYTEEIAELARRHKGTPPVSFVWGSLTFKGTVESVEQRFTMFLDDGKPVRAVLNVKMVSQDIAETNFGPKNRSAFDLTDPSWKLAVAGIVAAGKLRDVLKGLA